ncbi:MAG: tail fiber assembly protein [Pseudohongiellaceae bacterium]
MFVYVIDGQAEKFPYTLADLRLANPQLSIPDSITDEELEKFGVYSVRPATRPVFDSKTHRLRQSAQFVDKTWVQQWTVEQLDEDKAAANIRSDRNQRLTDSDWTQVPDAVNAGISIDAWASYRQQLRDVTTQPGFPWEVTWPEQPEPFAGVICDYQAFYNALLISPAYATIRSRAVESSSVLTACVEFIAAIGDAKNGRPNVPAIQACVDLLCAAAQFTAEELQALETVMEVGKLDQVYALPGLKSQ